jgi:hypothetical protein
VGVKSGDRGETIRGAAGLCVDQDTYYATCRVAMGQDCIQMGRGSHIERAPINKNLNAGPLLWNHSFSNMWPEYKITTLLNCGLL